jgi:FMN phosphatase YigB (HAD superfamily)
MLQAISKAYDLPPENILIVDDMVDVVSDAANAGFMACSPMEVVNLMNQED